MGESETVHLRACGMAAWVEVKTNSLRCCGAESETTVFVKCASRDDLMGARCHVSLSSNHLRRYVVTVGFRSALRAMLRA